MFECNRDLANVQTDYTARVCVKILTFNKCDCTFSYCAIDPDIRCADTSVMGSATSFTGPIQQQLVRFLMCKIPGQKNPAFKS
jgi:hypothetical protein